MPYTLTLTHQDPIASGSQRWVYPHPRHSKRLIKVLRPVPTTQGRAKLAVTTERLFPKIRRRWAYKEYQEYLRLMLDQTAQVLQPPITHMFGFCTTDKGLGCLTEAVLEGDTLGRTLADMIKSNSLTASDLSLFNDTIARLYAYNIRAGDMTARNFVFGHRDFAGRQGPRECVLVDGFGDIHAIPVRSWGAWANRLGLDDSCKRLAARTGLHWHRKHRHFTMQQEA